MKNKKNIIELLIIIVLGLTPLLWFRGNEIIMGHDAGLTLSPVPHFLDRLSSWTDRFGFGNDQTYAIPGFFIHGLEALVGVFTNDIQLVQKITFIFWFVLPGITMYYFASKLAKKYNFTFFALPVSLFYMFNHFLLQGWFVAERTKFSVYAALPIILALLFDWEERKRSTLFVGILISLTVFILNGVGSLPLFGGLIVSILVFIFWYFYQGFSNEKLRRILYLFFVIGLFSFLLNSYWILPFIYFISHSFSAVVSQAGGIGGVLGWLSYVSQDSSLINIFKLQGIPEWYQNPLHPYANVFLNNPLLIIVTSLIPVIAFLPLLLYRGNDTKKIILFFSVLALFSMIFIAGSHPPFGAIYVFLINFVPGFIAFRTPFYKFAPALWFAYAVLIGFTVNYALQKLSIGKKNTTYILYGLSCLAIVLYSYPFLTGSFFDYIKDLRTMRVNVPSYVYEYGKWSESEERINIRTLMLPPPSPAMKVDAYTWGYWSLSPLSSLLSNASVINNTGYMTEDETRLLDILYRKMKNNEPGWENLAKLLNIQSFVLRNDFAWDLKETPADNPEIYKDTLINSRFSLVKKFGQWEVYDFNNSEHKERIHVADTLHYLEGSVKDIGNIVSFPTYTADSVIYVSGTPATDVEELLNRAHTVFISPRCIMCSLAPPFVNEALFIPTFTPDSYLYPLVELREKGSLISPDSSPVMQVDYYLTKSLKDQKGLERVIDEKKSHEAIKKSIARYTSTLEQLNSALAILVKNNDRNNNDLLVKVYAYLRIEKKNFVEKFSTISGEIEPGLTNKAYDNIEKALALVANNAWYTSDLTNKKYIASSPQNGLYILAVKLASVSDSRNFSSRVIKYSIDDAGHTVKPQDLGNGWYSLGNVDIKKGIHTVEFEDSPQRNLYVSSESSQIVASVSGRQECFRSPIIPSESGDTFNISMNYMQRQGHAQYFLFPLQQFDSLPVLSNKGLNFKQSSNLEHVSTVYSSANNDGFYFMICPRIESEASKTESILEISNIVVNKMTTPELMLVNSIGSLDENEIVVSVARKTQTSYAVEATDNFKNRILLFNSSYSPNWELTGAGTNVFMANGYAKAWIINDDTKEIEIKYTPQRLVVLGFLISFVSLSLSLILLIIMMFKKYAQH
jgi:hypothetical protein